MNWEETVLQIPQGTEPQTEICRRCAYRHAQAEVSFKEGEVVGYKKGLGMREPYREGIRKVVEWVEAHITGISNKELLDSPLEYYWGWQAFKKENGLLPSETEE